MKNVFKYLTIAAASMICLVSCFQEKSEIPVYEPADAVPGAQYFFPSDAATLYVIKPTTTELKVPVSRLVKDAASSATIAVTDTSKVMYAEGAADVTVAFAANVQTDTLVIPIDYTKFAFGDYFGVDLAIKAETTPYGIASLHIEVSLPEPWKALGTGLYRDDLVTTFYGVDPSLEWEVEIEENELYPGLYRVVNAYGENYPYNDPGDWDDSKDYYMVIHAEDPEAVYVEMYYSEMSWSYGQFIFGSLAGYQIANGKTLAEMKEAGNTGTLSGGVITMPAGKMLIAMSGYNSGGLYYANNSGMFRVVLPGVVLADYTIGLEFEGLLTNKEGQDFAQANIAFEGEDVTSVAVLMVQGKDPAAAEAILVPEVAPEEGEDPGYIVVTDPGIVKFAFAEDAPIDKYTIYAVPVNPNGEFEWEYALYETFQYGEPGPFDKEYAAEDLIGGVTMDELTGTAWVGYGLALTSDGWDTSRSKIGNIVVTDIDNGTTGDELLTISGLSGPYGPYFGFDDAIECDLYNGTVYTHKSTNGSFSYQGTPLNVMTQWYDSAGDDVYNVNYAMIGAYVAEGLIAFVPYSSYVNQYGIVFDGLYYEAFTDADYKTSFGVLNGYRWILLADPTLYPNPLSVASAVTEFKKARTNRGKTIDSITR